MQNPCAHFGCVLLHQPRPTWEFAGRGNQVMRCVCVYLLSFASSFLPFASCSLIESINQSMKLSDLPSPLLSSPRFTITTNGIYSPAYATSPLPVPIQPWDPLSSLTEYPKYRSTYSSRPLPYSRLTCPPAFESPNPADWLHLSYLTALSLFIPQALSCGEILAFFPPSYFLLLPTPLLLLPARPASSQANFLAHTRGAQRHRHIQPEDHSTQHTTTYHISTSRVLVLRVSCACQWATPARGFPK
jgi:hypothetical protein